MQPRPQLLGSPNKTNGLPRTPTASTRRPLDRHRALPCNAGSPGSPCLIRAAHRHRSGGRPCVPGVAVSPPASFPPRLTATQLPLACGWCHQPPQGTFTPESLVMSGVHRVEARLALALRHHPACGSATGGSLSLPGICGMGLGTLSRRGKWQTPRPWRTYSPARSNELAQGPGRDRGGAATGDAADRQARRAGPPAEPRPTRGSWT
jgi:hypothetical protein